MDASPNTVVVTGFGPFRQHLVNSSWAAVKELFACLCQMVYPAELINVSADKEMVVTVDSGSHSLQEVCPTYTLVLERSSVVASFHASWISREDLRRSNISDWIQILMKYNLPELSKLGLGSEIDLHIAELPAVYQKAKELVCEIWTTRQPHLVIHVGLAPTSKATLILEQCGKNKGYKERDPCGFLPEDGCCVLEGPERIESTINMKIIWKNLLTEGIDAIFSRDAGRYVCDYTYYTSLYYGNRRAAFIHVPPLSKWITAEVLGRALQRVILEMLKQCKWKRREQSKGEPLEDEQENPGRNEGTFNVLNPFKYPPDLKRKKVST